MFAVVQLSLAHLGGKLFRSLLEALLMLAFALPILGYVLGLGLALQGAGSDQRALGWLLLALSTLLAGMAYVVATYQYVLRGLDEAQAQAEEAAVLQREYEGLSPRTQLAIELLRQAPGQAFIPNREQQLIARLAEVRARKKSTVSLDARYHQLDEPDYDNLAAEQAERDWYQSAPVY